ncbi:MAG: methylated-DNA--[protein]-cysteine S-methyltransferase [Hyphococcus sp.]
MENAAHAFFMTTLGRAGIAWRDAGVYAVAFPGDAPEQMRARFQRPGEGVEETDNPPAKIKRLIADITALFEGAAIDLSYADLDHAAAPAFDRSVWREALKIAPGELRTYGDIARALGDVSFSRRVGQALARNPVPIIVPCHRVVGADGAMTGFSATGGAEAKRTLLKTEGALGPELFD